MAGQDGPDSGISYLVNKGGGGNLVFKIGFPWKKNNQKMLRHSGRPLGAQACHPPALQYIQDAEGVPPPAGTVIGHACLQTLPTTSTTGHISAKRSAWPTRGTGRA